MDGQGKGSKVFDIVAPLAAGAMASYGPNGVAAATAGVRMLDRQQALRRRHALGEDIVRLADTMGEKDFQDRTKSWNQIKPEGGSEDVAAVIDTLGEEGADAALATVPMPGEKMGSKELRKYNTDEERLTEFLSQFPEPVRDETFSALGDMGMNDPEAALAFINDKQKFGQQVRLAEMAYYQDQLKERVRMAHDDEQNEINRSQAAWQRQQDQDFQTELTTLVEGFKDERSNKDNTAAFDRTKYSADAGVEAASVRAEAYTTANLDKVDAASREKIESLQADIAQLLAKNGVLDTLDTKSLFGEDLVKFQELEAKLAREWGQAGLGEFGAYEYVGEGADRRLVRNNSNLVGKHAVRADEE